MENKKEAFDTFFTSLEEGKSNTEQEPKDSVPVETPKEMLSDPEVPPPSPRAIKEYEVNVSSYENMVSVCVDAIQNLPFQDKEDYKRAEAFILTKRCHFEEDMSPNELSRQLFFAQENKDCISAITSKAHVNYLRRKRFVEVLTSAYNAISQQKTVDKRKSDASIRLFEFVNGCDDAEVFYIQCKYYFDNADSQHKTVSRRITCMQAQMTLGEIHPSGEISGFASNDGESEEPDFIR